MLPMPVDILATYSTYLHENNLNSPKKKINYIFVIVLDVAYGEVFYHMTSYLAMLCPCYITPNQGQQGRFQQHSKY